MNKVSMLFLVTVLIGTSVPMAEAGVAITKSKHKVMSDIKYWTDRIQSECGINLNVTVDWATAETLDFSVDGRNQANGLVAMSAVASDYVSSFHSLCVKPEIKAIMSGYSAMYLSPMKNVKAKPKSNRVSVNGGTISVKFAPLILDTDSFYKLENAL